MLVRAQAASNWTRVCGERRNSTKRLTTPVSMTRSIGGLRSLDKSLRNLVVAEIWSSILSEKTPWTMIGRSSFSWKIVLVNCSDFAFPRVVDATYRTLSVGSLIIAVRRRTERSTRSALAAVANASPLGEVLLALLLANLDLLLLTAAAELIGLESVLGLEGGAAVLGNITVRHGGCVVCSGSVCGCSAVCVAVAVTVCCAFPGETGSCGKPRGVRERCGCVFWWKLGGRCGGGGKGEVWVVVVKSR
jgi:hypothetical protein